MSTSTLALQVIDAAHHLHPFTNTRLLNVGEATMEGLLGSLQLTPNKAARAAFKEKGEVGLKARDFSFENGLVMRAVVDRMVIAHSS